MGRRVVATRPHLFETGTRAQLPGLREAIARLRTSGEGQAALALRLPPLLVPGVEHPGRPVTHGAIEALGPQVRRFDEM